jgi:hypothetical protein
MPVNNDGILRRHRRAAVYDKVVEYSAIAGDGGRSGRENYRSVIMGKGA